MLLALELNRYEVHYRNKTTKQLMVYVILKNELSALYDPVVNMENPYVDLNEENKKVLEKLCKYLGCQYDCTGVPDRVAILHNFKDRSDESVWSYLSLPRIQNELMSEFGFMYFEFKQTTVPYNPRFEESKNG